MRRESIDWSKTIECATLEKIIQTLNKSIVGSLLTIEKDIFLSFCWAIRVFGSATRAKNLTYSTSIDATLCIKSQSVQEKWIQYEFKLSYCCCRTERCCAVSFMCSCNNDAIYIGVETATMLCIQRSSQTKLWIIMTDWEWCVSVLIHRRVVYVWVSVCVREFVFYFFPFSSTPVLHFTRRFSLSLYLFLSSHFILFAVRRRVDRITCQLYDSV